MNATLFFIFILERVCKVQNSTVGAEAFVPRYMTQTFILYTNALPSLSLQTDPKLNRLQS